MVIFGAHLKKTEIQLKSILKLQVTDFEIVFLL